MANDPMFKLEHTSDDVKKSSSVQLSVGQLEKKRSEFQDDYSLNKLARSKFRVTVKHPSFHQFYYVLFLVAQVNVRRY